MSSGLLIKSQPRNGKQEITTDFSKPFMMIDRTVREHEQAIELTVNSIDLPYAAVGVQHGVMRYRNDQYGFDIDYHMIIYFIDSSVPEIVYRAASAPTTLPIWKDLGAGQNASVNYIANKIGMRPIQWITWETLQQPQYSSGSFSAKPYTGNYDVEGMFYPKKIYSAALNSQKGLIWDYGFITRNSPLANTGSMPNGTLVQNSNIALEIPMSNTIFATSPTNLSLRQTKDSNGQVFAELEINAGIALITCTFYVYDSNSPCAWFSDGQDTPWNYVLPTLVKSNIKGSIINLYIRAFSNDTKNSYSLPGGDKVVI